MQEVTYNALPDIQFELLGRPWLMAVKLGESPAAMKEAFLQYLRHKEESGIQDGLVLLLPDELRNVRPEESAIRAALAREAVTVFVDAGPVKDEIRGRPFPEVLDLLVTQIGEAIRARQVRYFPLHRVIALLREQVIDLMQGLRVDEHVILKVVTDRDLLTSLAQKGRKEAQAAAQFLAAYIILSQILFLRLLVSAELRTARGEVLTVPKKITRFALRQVIRKVWDVNYRPIYEIDVLDNIPEPFLQDTFDLIWGLEVERVRHDLPGRIFHDLMPPVIRKLLAAFYTRPQAADLLAQLTITQGDETVFDPACGSGTILVSAYRAKVERYQQQGVLGNPHRRFCEEQIFGADIMPFAVHLASANLAAMDVGTTITRTQVIPGDSLRLAPHETYTASLTGPRAQTSVFPRTAPRARTTAGEEYDVDLQPVDVILMNPPFTKVERGIARFVKMDNFREVAGGEVGLWGHFVFLANEFLEEEGTFGAVLPINVLRGRESAHVRTQLLQRWTPLYVLKSTLHYGFSEWAEYRDVLFIAKKERSNPHSPVKFILVKRDLTRLGHADIADLARSIRSDDRVRSDELDIDTHPVAEVWKREPNLMSFIGGVNFTGRDVLVRFTRHLASLAPLHPDTIVTGVRLDGGLSDVLYLTRALTDSRVEQALLRFNHDRGRAIEASTANPVGRNYEIPKNVLVPSLRTPVGLPCMDITGEHDYLTVEPHEEMAPIRRAAGYRRQTDWPEVWQGVQGDTRDVSCHTSFVHRFNPFSPDTHHMAFFSRRPISPSDQMNVILEDDEGTAKALCVLMNSVVFLAQFFLEKEESTGRIINVRLYDLAHIRIFPPAPAMPQLARVFDQFGRVKFPSLREQLDRRFEDRYEEFWSRQRERPLQLSLWGGPGGDIEPEPARIEMDLAVCGAIGVPASEDEIRSVYRVIVEEMIITRGLRKD